MNRRKSSVRRKQGMKTKRKDVESKKHSCQRTVNRRGEGPTQRDEVRPRFCYISKREPRKEKKKAA